MWRTPLGERVLVGEEAVLLRDAIAHMTDLLHDEANGPSDAWPFGVELFDELPWQQRLALLSQVASALFRPNVPAPELSAVNEAMVGAIFASLRQNVEIELDEADLDGPSSDGDSTFWRRRIAACQEAPRSEDDFYVLEICTDKAEWDILLEVLSASVLWDGDWNMPDLFLDVEPDVSRERRENLGIVRDYFTTPAPDPHDSQVAEIFDDLCRLVQGR